MRRIIFFVDGTEIVTSKGWFDGLLGTKLSTYLEDKLKKQLKDDWKKYSKTIKLYYLGEDGKNSRASQTDESGIIYKVSEGIVIFNNKLKSTASHELLHWLGLSHSFSNEECNTRYQAKFTYKVVETENLMDYSHHDPAHLNDRCALWQWQWAIANS